ncbi:hypothetical protein FHS09_002597 [Microbulbifer rhizosphaerae]|uniref:Uncharacterized protein n=1 Tax=Microbulbifer rhizosphaerae TaxID=1562603 RepID=A0A7W4WCL4_9GAMM|nr:hypothetical protein [Microbulbifer rhizosphaerae]
MKYLLSVIAVALVKALQSSRLSACRIPITS